MKFIWTDARDARATHKYCRDVFDGGPSRDRSFGAVVRPSIVRYDRANAAMDGLDLGWSVRLPSYTYLCSHPLNIGSHGISHTIAAALYVDC
jgi:hypothetical protein